MPQVLGPHNSARHVLSVSVKTITKSLLLTGVEYSSRNVLTDSDLREGVKKFSEWPTIPQVYIDGEFVGGSDILMGMHKSGDLKKMFLKEQA